MTSGRNFFRGDCQVNRSVDYYLDVINSDQCRMARAALRMTQNELAERAGITAMTIKRFEGGADPRASIANRIERALVSAGVVLIEEDENAGPGVRLTKEAVRRDG
jgi:transcriptional regulator with XRE-family HTH domain